MRRFGTKSGLDHHPNDFLSLGIPPPAYLARMQDTFEMRHFLVGLSKAPVFAMLIGLIGCLEGMQVKAPRNRWANAPHRAWFRRSPS